ncbi:hypothetical protein PHAVU_002G189000, partial [Phaseolus vulgaris]
MTILNDQPALVFFTYDFKVPFLMKLVYGRDYNIESERQKGVEEFYRLQHTNQTYDFAKRMREIYVILDKAEMGIWECCELLNEVVDDSDPDLDEAQIQHLLQSAEAIRKDYPDQDWLHLTALIHDLGKILLLPRFGALPQWAVVGDTFPLGCAFDESNIHHKKHFILELIINANPDCILMNMQYFKNNPDYQCPGYKTKNGIYTEGCGLQNVMMSWGHDEYMYLVAKKNGSTLPSAGLFIIRFHSFYPLHKEGAYTHLMNEEDVENLKWLEVFNKYDLYSKSKVLVDVEKVKPYYMSLIEKILLFLSTNRDSHDIVDFSDLRKILVLPAFGELPQLAVFGDTFLVGCVFDKSNIHHKYFKDNPDYKCYAYNTKNGIYTEGCGLDNIVMSWGHNDYMYMVAKENGNNFPSAGLFIIRYHSFYTLRKKGAYTHLMNEEDFETLKWLEVFK